VFNHITEIEYTMDVPEPRNFADDQSASTMNWVQQEKNLIKIVEKLIDEGSQPRTINLGEISLSEHDGCLVAALGHEANRLEWLALVPAFPDEEFDPTAFDLGDNCCDLLAACVTLGSAGRVAIDGELNLIVLPPDNELGALPFRLQISISVSLILPAISVPITGKVKRTVTLIEDAQRRLLDFAFPSSLSPVEEPFAGDASIPFFYSVLGPAPDLPSKIAEAAMQPPDLRPTLLPFQRRSVGWLLEREGMTVTRSGEIVPKQTQSSQSLPLFWDEIPLANESWYINRLTGVLTPSRPRSQSETGGRLAEEPGLGKTLMCISLVLLNPAPTRNPSVKCWDPIARLDVKEIKVTLFPIGPHRIHSDNQ
jgi:E3 ubiquitin-protein ligase SHPRH